MTVLDRQGYILSPFAQSGPIPRMLPSASGCVTQGVCHASRGVSGQRKVSRVEA